MFLCVTVMLVSASNFIHIDFGKDNGKGMDNFNTGSHLPKTKNTESINFFINKKYAFFL